MVRKGFGIIVMLLLILSACSSKTGDHQGHPNDNGVPEIIEVHVQILPEKGEPGKPITIQAVVTQGQERVTDANEVLFEVWKKGQEEEHEKIAGSHQGEGVYVLEKTFPEDGLYYVISHVTARGMHSMPTTAFAVGQVSEEDLHEIEQVNGGDGDHGDHSDHGGQDGHDAGSQGHGDHEGGSGTH